MRTLLPLLLLLVIAISTAQESRQPSLPVNPNCAPLGQPYLRTTLYFGTARMTGFVSESEWQNVLRKRVTPRFPQGLTVWQADGQWRCPDGKIGKERAKVLLLVHENTPSVLGALAELVADYKQEFQQESVLWETAPVCAAF